MLWNENYSIEWKTPIPEWGTSTPAVWGRALFITSEVNGELLLLRLNAETGEVEWTKNLGSAEATDLNAPRGKQKFHQLHNQASPSPITDGAVVIVHFGNGDLLATDLEGNELWRTNLQDRYGKYSIWWGHANSPVLVGNLVISICMQDSLADQNPTPSPSYLVAHDKRNGRERWRTDRMTEASAEECDSYTTPILVESNQQQQLVIMGGNELDAYDPKTGNRLWFLAGLKGGRTITGPTAAHGMIYCTRGMRGDLLAVRPGDKPKLSDRNVVWRQGNSTPDTCCPVVWEDLLFVVSDEGISRCFNAHTGHIHWSQRLPGDYKASPIAAEGRIYFLNTEGTTTVVSADDRFRKLAENKLDDVTIASPAISNGRLIIRGQKNLYSIKKP